MGGLCKHHHWEQLFPWSSCPPESRGFHIPLPGAFRGPPNQALLCHTPLVCTARVNVGERPGSGHPKRSIQAKPFLLRLIQGHNVDPWPLRKEGASAALWGPPAIQEHSAPCCWGPSLSIAVRFAEGIGPVPDTRFGLVFCFFDYSAQETQVVTSHLLRVSIPLRYHE